MSETRNNGLLFSLRPETKQNWRKPDGNEFGVRLDRWSPVDGRVSQSTRDLRSGRTGWAAAKKRQQKSEEEGKNGGVPKSLRHLPKKTKRKRKQNRKQASRLLLLGKGRRRIYMPIDSCCYFYVSHKRDENEGRKDGKGECMSGK